MAAEQISQQSSINYVFIWIFFTSEISPLLKYISTSQNISTSKIVPHLKISLNLNFLHIRIVSTSKILHMTKNSPRTMSAASATNIKYGMCGHLRCHFLLLLSQCSWEIVGKSVCDFNTTIFYDWLESLSRKNGAPHHRGRRGILKYTKKYIQHV